jgi:hypothetical protein
MTNFKSARINGFWYILKQWAVGLAFAAIGYLIIYLLRDFLNIQSMNWSFLLIAMSISYFLGIGGRSRINEIVFDNEKRKLLIRYYNLYEGRGSEVFDFDKIKIKMNKSGFFNKSTICSISILKGRREEYELSIAKDGFSKETFKELTAYLDSLTHTS